MYIPPFEKLEAANKEELLKIIKSIKIKMRRLKVKMEHPDYRYRTNIKCSTDLLIYKRDRNFLDRAISKYIEIGGDYKFSKSELSDICFNEKVGEISKIIFTNGGFFEVEQKTVVTLIENEVKVETGIFGDLVPFDIGYDKENFLYEFGRLHIGEWRRHYMPENFGMSTLDGEQWSLKIEYNDGKEKEYAGINAYPYNYEDLISLLGISK